MDPPPSTPTQAAALARAQALTEELIELVALLREEAEPVDTLGVGDLRSAFSAAVNAQRRRPRWVDELLT
jgi:hypothetical protein